MMATETAALDLRAGEWVQVRPAEQILATLDSNACLDGLPFMPEMLQYCGRRFRVYKSAHKTCDTIESFSIRHMSRAVHLEGLRCDGSGHGGCEAMCLLFWKEAWLERAPSGAGTGPAHPNGGTASSADVAKVHAGALASSAGDAEERFRCQATELRNATTEVVRRDRWNPAFYLKDLTSGNVTLRDFVKFGLFATFNAMMLHLKGRRYPQVCGLAGSKTPDAQLNLQPGELVQVRSKDEIMQTLNARQRNRGLFYDVEMIPYSDGTYKVLRRVEKIIDEKSGRMTKIPNSCLILDGVTCSGHLSSYRMFCPRSIYPYWREVWLKRAGQ